MPAKENLIPAATSRRLALRACRRGFAISGLIRLELNQSIADFDNFLAPSLIITQRPTIAINKRACRSIAISWPLQ